MQRTWLTAAALAVGCSRAPEPAAPVPIATAAPRRPAAPAPSVLRADHGDLDGDGVDDPFSIDAAGVLAIGHVQAAVPVDADVDVSFEVVALDASRTGRRLLVIETPEGEDPPHRVLMFRYDGRSIELVLDRSVESRLVFPGDGTAHAVETDWSRCGQPSVPQQILYFDVTLAPDARGRLVETARTPTGQSFGCDQWAACPYVDVLEAGGVTRVGEILRWLRGADAYARQTLALPSSDADLRVRISEEKPEITYLDEIHLERDGTAIAPAACAAAAPPAYCAADHEMYVLHTGESFDLDFAASGGDLVATGYYLPTPAARADLPW